MFVVSLHYVAPLEKIDARMTEHVKFLNKYYGEGVFIASGRKVPRTGGIILAHGVSLQELEAIIGQDPFVTNKLAEFTITQFQNSQVHPDFRKLIKT